MDRNLDKLLLLMWKNGKLRANKIQILVFEILIIFGLIFFLEYVLVKRTFNSEVIYKQFCPLTPEMSKNIKNKAGLILCDPEANNADTRLPKLPNFSEFKKYRIFPVMNFVYAQELLLLMRILPLFEECLKKIDRYPKSWLAVRLRCEIQDTSIKKESYDLARSLTLMYSPNTSVAINSVMEFFQPFFGNIVSFANIEAMNTYYKVSSPQVITGGIVFKSKSGNLEDLANLNVQIRLPSELTVYLKDAVSDWQTKRIFPQDTLSGPRSFHINTGSSPSYYGEGFLALQYITVTALTVVKNNVDVRERNQWIEANYPYVNMRRFAFNSWSAIFVENLPVVLSSLFIAGSSYSVLHIVTEITSEKEEQLKETMKIMGLPNWLHWTAWFLTDFVVLAIAYAVFVAMLKGILPGTVGLLKYANYTVTYVLLLFYLCTTISFSFVFSTFFSKANYASIIAALVWALTYSPFLIFSFLPNYSFTPVTILFISLLPNSGMAFAFQIISVYEGTEEGIKWSDLFSATHNCPPLGYIMLIMILDTFLFLFIAIYIEAVFPGEYGVPKPWNFLCTKSYWCGKSKFVDVSDETDIDNDYYRDKSDVFETEPSNLHAGIRIKNLRKEYGYNVAVQNLTLNMFEDQITVLVGHNGAGKTTTMLMLTGIITPTRGTAIVNGHDIRKNIEGVRRSLSLCPQNNVLFNNLTISNHFHFFGKLKGLKGEELKTEINKYVTILDINKKEDITASKLSGGMKRKLAVGLALCGGSKIVMLDEPSSGVDPAARRAMWNIIDSERKGRTILLSTHFMDEADILGDRIAVMAGGQLQCCGSSFFLKKNYGTGYRLIIEKTSSCNVLGVQTLLTKYVPDIKVNSNVGSELSFLLPERYSPVFEAMLRDLESQTKKLGVESFGISLSTMEDVFMKTGVAQYNEISKGPTRSNTGNRDIKIDVAAAPTYTRGLGLISNQFYAMFLKRLVTYKRSWFTLLFPICLPCVSLLFTILATSNNIEALPPIDLTLNRFTNPVTLIQKEKNYYIDAYKKLVAVEVTDNITQTMLDLIKSKPTITRFQYIVGADIKASAKHKASLTAYFNNEAYHSPGISLSLILNTIFRVKTKCETCSIDFVNYPLEYRPLSTITKINTSPIEPVTMLTMSVVAGVFSIFIIRENVSKSKHLQFVSGLKVFIFWTSHLLCDLLVCIPIIVAYCMVLICFQLEGYNTAAAIGCVIVIFFCFSCAMLTFTYTLAYTFKKPSSGLDHVPSIYITLGIVSYYFIQWLGKNDEYTNVANSFHWIFLLNPSYALISALGDLYNFNMYNNLCTKWHEACAKAGLSKETCVESMNPKLRDICEDFNYDYYKWKPPGIRRNIVVSLTETVVLFILLIAIELRLTSNVICCLKRTLFWKCPVSVDEDSDVAEERERIRNSNKSQLKSEHIVVVKDLTKYYRSFLAVNGICLGIRESECFGLLGENGAGKTTTFRMMTGEENITYGNGWVNGYNIVYNQKNARKNIGYCPQFDGLLDYMTVKENLIIIALIRGITFKDSCDISDRLAIEFDFAAYLDKKVKHLSGGNKRKLSTALSVIGDPKILYLDEPTTGVDPAAKRCIWSALNRHRESGKSIVLSSHSMEECEALCTRLAIMVQGNFKCLGSKQHLKSKFAQGYSLSIKMKKIPDSSENRQPVDTTNVERFVSEKFPNAKLEEKYEDLLTYQIPHSKEPWSKLFAILEKGKKDYSEIEDYSLGQCTLEQVFLQLTRKKKEN